MPEAFGASRVTVKPPERGIFPLDHEGECKASMQQYLNCLKTSDNDHIKCRELSKKYLLCRMDKDLMAKEDVSRLGLGDEQRVYIRNKPDDSKVKEGFIAGLEVAGSSKGFFGIFNHPMAPHNINSSNNSNSKSSSNNSNSNNSNSSNSNSNSNSSNSNSNSNSNNSNSSNAAT